ACAVQQVTDAFKLTGHHRQAIRRCWKAGRGDPVDSRSPPVSYTRCSAMKKISQPFGVRYIGGPQDGYVVRAEPSPTNVIIAPVRPFADRVTSGSNNGRTNKRVAVYEFVGA